MKIGDLVRFNDPTSFKRQLGIVTRVDSSHRQIKIDVLLGDDLKSGIWEGHLEIINENEEGKYNK